MFVMPGASLSDLPIAFHQAGKKVFGLNQTDPMIILATTHATTASQLTEPKSISASFGNEVGARR
jgi:hypothetical protein